MINSTRREFLGTTVAAGFGAALSAQIAGNPEADGTPPNILFIFSDDHAAQAIGAYGSRINKTPHIDRIAREGALFENCFCANSICGPSRATVLTGTFSHVNGFTRNGNTFDGEQVTYPKLLQQAGYQTAMIGKWHLRSQPTGFEEYDILPGQGAYYNPDFINRNGKRRIQGYTTDIITDLSLDWLSKKRDPNRPFLLHCWHKAPHRNWMPGPKYLTKYDDQKIWEPPTLFDDYATRSTPVHEQEMTIARHMTLSTDLKVTPPLLSESDVPGPFRRLTDEQKRAWDQAYVPRNEAFRQQNLQGDALVRWKYQRYIKDYLRCIDSVDESVGRLLEFLDDHGLADNTIVVYSSDQGFYLGEHGWFDKRWMYEESLRMPLLIRWPRRIKPETRLNQLVQNIDFAPTCLDAAGLPPHQRIQGESLLPLLQDQDTPWRQSIYYHYYEFPGAHNVQKHCGVRTANHKLIHLYPVDEWEFYDLKNDPRELNNKIDDPEYAAQVAAMRLELKRLQNLYGDNTVRTAAAGAREARAAGFDYWEKVTQVEATDTGVLLRGDPAQDGTIVLRKLNAPVQTAITLKSSFRRRVSSGICNGFLAVAPADKPGKVLRAGVYIRANRMLVQSGLDTLADKPLPGNPDRIFETAMTVDLRKKKITLVVNDQSITTDLPAEITDVAFVGYSLNRTATEFTPLELQQD